MTSAPSSPANRELPAEFVKSLSAHSELDGLAEALATTAPEVSVRVNAAKGLNVPEDADRVPWCRQGVYLPDRPSFTFDPALHQGLYYVQDASSMILQGIAASLTAADEPVRWLDACSAPGGKTTAIADVLPSGSLLVANEFDPKRARALVENVERWGNPDVMITTGDTVQFSSLHHFFDIISVDAPCSGEGMMRKEEVAVTQWSQGLVRQCAALQREILENVWTALRPGGYLIYSTCTFNTAEDEENVAWLTETFGAESIRLDVDGLADVLPALEPFRGQVHALRFLPGRVRGEGLFAAVLRKPGNGVVAPAELPRKLKSPVLPAGWLQGKFIGYEDRNGVLYALPADTAAARLRVMSAVRTLTPGIVVGTVKGKDVVPAQALATSTALDPGAFATVDVSADDALAFLQGQALHLPSATPRGFVLLTYKYRPLGFVKNIGNRCNNLLPDARRIRSQAGVITDILQQINITL